eukprot:217242-Karenia_brevis.AAC.1
MCSASVQPSLRARRVDNGSALGDCSMRCDSWGASLHEISFNAAISASEKGLQWQCVAPLL